MALSVKHVYQSATADDPTREVSSTEWNQDHAVVGTVPIVNGGTDIASYAVGDILYGSSTTSLAKLGAVATGNALLSGGAITAPSWGKIGLTTHVTGTLPVANGGTNAITAAAALTSLGAVAKAGDTMSGDLTVAKASLPRLVLNQTAVLSDTNWPALRVQTNGVTRWEVSVWNTAAHFSIDRYNASGVALDNPIMIDGATGTVNTNTIRMAGAYLFKQGAFVLREAPSIEMLPDIATELLRRIEALEAEVAQLKAR